MLKDENENVRSATRDSLIKLGWHRVTLLFHPLYFRCRNRNYIIALAVIFVVNLSNNMPERLIETFAVRNLNFHSVRSG